jgi:hypothetical protein
MPGGMPVAILMFDAGCACAAVAPIIKRNAAAPTLAVHLIVIGISIRQLRSW